MARTGSAMLGAPSEEPTMQLPQLQAFLLWCAALNYGVLLLVFGAWVLAGDRLYRLHARWFELDRARCDQAIYLMLGLYKLAIWLLFLVPWLALRVMAAG
jgi:hypothetical protein